MKHKENEPTKKELKQIEAEVKIKEWREELKELAGLLQMHEGYILPLESLSG